MKPRIIAFFLIFTAHKPNIRQILKTAKRAKILVLSINTEYFGKSAQYDCFAGFVS